MTEFNFSWLLLVVPAAFALGWVSSRFDLRQWKREQSESPKAYYKGLNLLLNEQQDKAIDAFIEAVQHDPDTTELHFALGNLFRRRGEFERAVRVHQHLLSRADLPSGDRDRAQHALAQDYLKAGLFDRAEAAYRELEGTAYATDARRALLDLYERARDWSSAVEMASRLERSGVGSYSARMAHHWCEMAADVRSSPTAAEREQALRRAAALAPQAARPLVQLGQLLVVEGRVSEALETWGALLRLPTQPLTLVAPELVDAALAAGAEAATTAHALLSQAYRERPSLDVLQALNRLQPEQARSATLNHLAQSPTLSAASAVVKLGPAQWDEHTAEHLQRALEATGKPLRRYRCAACGFEAQRYFWQCPGCLGWDTYPPQRLEDE